MPRDPFSVPSALPDPPPAECLFCGIVAGSVPSLRVDEDEQTVAFLDVGPATRGHTLVVPRRHSRDLLGAPDDDLAACLVAAARVAARLVDRLGATGVNVLNACGTSAWQSVPHLHLHVVPRYDDDAVPHPWAPQPATREELAATAALVTAPAPDTKDWTWVLERPCPECGFEAAGVAPSAVPALVRDNAAAWAARLRGPVHRRPAPGVWSPLEYACHVRDVLRLYDERLGLMLDQDDPLYANWDQDATAVTERYGEQDPAVVSRELEQAARAVADRFAGLAPEQWSRRGRRSDGATFTVTSFARYFLHDLVHHLHDVRGHGPTG